MSTLLDHTWNCLSSTPTLIDWLGICSFINLQWEISIGDILVKRHFPRPNCDGDIFSATFATDTERSKDVDGWKWMRQKHAILCDKDYINSFLLVINYQSIIADIRIKHVCIFSLLFNKRVE